MPSFDRIVIRLGLRDEQQSEVRGLAVTTRYRPGDFAPPNALLVAYDEEWEEPMIDLIEAAREEVEVYVLASPDEVGSYRFFEWLAMQPHPDWERIATYRRAIRTHAPHVFQDKYLNKKHDVQIEEVMNGVWEVTFIKR